MTATAPFTPPPLALYVHVPWCVRKCPYCDFNSHTHSGELPEHEYAQALLADLELDVHAVQGRELVSIFFGGGTPSLLAPQTIGAILEGVGQRVAFASDIEITLEANPGTAEQQRFSGFRAAGVNRLSLGIQSLNPKHLQLLGRIHDRAQALRAVDMARAAGFDNINLDLMHGLPQQDVDDAAADLQQAIALAPEHLSWYQLTIEPNTEFYKRPPALPPDDTLAAIQEHGFALLAAAGFQQYEVSAFSRPGRSARHNCNYWLFGDYLGIGAGAHGKSSYGDGRIERTRKTRLPRDYLGSGGRCERSAETVAAGELPFEFMLNVLRLTEGFDQSLFEERTGLPWSTVAPAVTDLIARGLLAQTGARIAPTPLGQRFLNDVLTAFMD